MNDHPSSEFDQQQLQAIHAAAVDAIITIDEFGIVESINPATEKMFGFAAKEIIGQNIKMLMPDPFRSEHDQYLANFRESGIPKIIGIGRGVVGKKKNGESFPIHLAVSEVSISNRRFFTGIVRDISDLKAVEARLEQLNEELEQRVADRTQELEEAQASLVRSERLAMLGQVSGGIAHEIRNPLNAVKTSAYFLLNAKDLPAEKVTEHLERIDRQVTSINNVITALSDVARLPKPDFHSIDAMRCIRKILSTTMFPENVRTVIQPNDNTPLVVADENQIEIAFRNLIRNARDAMPDGGQLTVATFVEDEEIGFCVSDTGIGISADALERITEPLYSTKARGMGLGLAITRSIVEKNHGRLEFESEIGEGTKVTIVLPRSSNGGV